MLQSEQRTLYAVRTREGFVGTRRFDYGRGSYSNRNRPFEQARLFARRCDAKRACEAGDIVEEVHAYVIDVK